MSSLLDFYKVELGDARFFILDSKSDHLVYGDLDFEEYHWDRAKFNKVRPGDFFLYRRPQKASEIKNQFYIYGAGRIGQMIEVSNASGPDKVRQKPVYATIEQGIAFENPILQSDLENFQWSFKTRGPTWEYFFQQYGMNEIHADDFWRLLNIGVQGNTYKFNASQTRVEQEVADYFVEDKRAHVKIRGVEQREFALKVKLNYQYQCAISGIKTKDFLVASHIIPWSENYAQRTNPRNGICLSSLLDKAFDTGFMTIDEKFKVCIANKALHDQSLYIYLKQYEGQRLQVPKSYQPDQNFLAWHRQHVFLDNHSADISFKLE